MTGPPFFTGPAGAPVAWSPRNLTYFTDPGDLSPYVDHQAADALVAAAAAVWNLPVANLSLAQGGPLAEHVSGANVYLGTGGVVYPADVASANYAAIPIAVVYDTDGSVTDTLLGAGASAPSGCRQNAVTESVDLFDPAGYILHAVVLVNGRCTGSAAAAQLQLQYQMERAFGRVLGLAWSQTNDNVFTGRRVPSYQEALHWPILHPMDIVCGSYTYQCLPMPFQLRPDDMASMVLLYGIGQNDPVPAGKQISLANATGQQGSVSFPTGEGMAGVNVLVQRTPGYTGVEESWATASAVTGTFFRRTGSTPLAPVGTDPNASDGSADAVAQGTYRIAYIPMPDGYGVDNHVVTMEPVNALYIGGYSLGPYGPGAVTPSGTPAVPIDRFVYAPGVANQSDTVADAASQCGTGLDGSEASPAPADASGWWPGLLCGYGHTAWVGLAVKPQRTLTFDATALDAQGNATTAKAMPTLGAWSATDPIGTLPTLGATVVAFNAASLGTTRLTLATEQLSALRLAIVDQRGEGRPDFGFQARILYADSIVPAGLPLAGGKATVAGMGFRPGNAVTVNGVAATVSSWTATAIVLTIPTMSAAGATAGTAVDVTVTDRSTGAASTMAGAFSYSGTATLPETMQLVTAPHGTIFSGEIASVAFAVQVLAADGVTPAPGETVSFSAGAGSIQFAACGGPVCAVTTDANGIASTGVMPLTVGTATAEATDGSLTQIAAFIGLPPVGSLRTLSSPVGPVPLGDQAQPGFVVQVLQPNGAVASGVPVTFTASPAGAVEFVACQASSCTLTTDVYGSASTGAIPLAVGSILLTATVDSRTQTAAFTAFQPLDRIAVVAAPSGTVAVGSRSALVIELTASDGVTPLFGRSVTLSGPPGIVFDACSGSPCTLITNWSGIATGVLAAIPGTFTIHVGEMPSVGVQSDTQTVTFTAVQATQTMSLLSVPANGSLVGVPASLPFSIRLLAADGTQMPVGTQVAFSPVLPGSASLQACPRSPCSLYTDAQGVASTGIVPLVAGPIALQAIYGILAQTATFTAFQPLDQVSIIAAPSGTVPLGSSSAFRVSLFASDGFTALSGRQLLFTAPPGLTFDACNAATCTVTSTPTGASIGVLANALGTYTMQVGELPSVGIASNLQTVTFTVVQPVDAIRFAAVPTATVAVGAVAPFQVALTASDGVTPLPRRKLTFTAPPGVTFDACHATICTVATDTSGLAAIGSIAALAGTFTIHVREVASFGIVSNVQAAAFTVAVPPPTMRLVSAPAVGARVKVATAIPFSVQLLHADGVTPLAGAVVTLGTATPGTATFSACPASPCLLTTDAQGTVASGVTPLVSGSIGLQAIYGSIQRTASFTAADWATLTAAQTTVFVAPGATVDWPLRATANVDGTATLGESVAWTVSTGFAVSTATSYADAAGLTQVDGTVGPLAGGATATATACVLGPVCVAFLATGVSNADLRLTLVSGAGQSVSGGGGLQPVTFQVVDVGGDPVAGAVVTVYQTATAAGLPCPAHGRCPAAPVVDSSISSAISNGNGLAMVTPLVWPQGAETTHIAAIVGTQGFATADLAWAP